jgi:tRNA 2-selenouridine synthase
MPQLVSLPSFLELPYSTFDIRSPIEFNQGHLPHSISFPLFSNEERVLVGTSYKKQGKQEAITLGIELVNKRLDQIALQASQSIQEKGCVKVLCWRGGMRSGFMARYLDYLGYSTIVLERGYKTFRRWVLETLTHHFPCHALRVIGGLTGSGKTILLNQLREQKEQVIDLEQIANHQGSVFGQIGRSTPQPTQEQFENNLAWIVKDLDGNRPIWIEDENRLIGSCCLPSLLYTTLQQAPFFFIQVSKEKRLQNLLEVYGQGNAQCLITATEKIKSRLGGVLTKQIQDQFRVGNYLLAFDNLLSYYDKAYHYHLEKRSSPYQVGTEEEFLNSIKTTKS